MKIPFEGLSLTIVTSPDVSEVFEFEIDSIAATSGTCDYHVPLSDFNLNNFDEDKSKTNASSVSAIVECDGKRFLWLSDSVPSQYVPALKNIRDKYQDSLSFNIVSMAHHGSNGNTTLDYINMISCSRFIITANGANIHNLPNKETLARFIMNPDRNYSEQQEFIFPSDSAELRNMFKVDGENVEEKLNFKLLLNCDTMSI